jgi:hypothetical protein
MDFLLNNMNKSNNGKNERSESNYSTDTTGRHDFLFGLDDSGIATSNDVHSIEYDDQLPITPPPTIVQSKLDEKSDIANVRIFDKSKASTSIPSLSINSNATINIHYYPEESIFWSYVIVFISTFIQIVTHGLQMSFGIFLLSAKNFFIKDNVDMVSYGKFNF